MSVNNINALVDLEGLQQLNNSDYVSKYYNTGLANQGQRYTDEVLLEYLSFTVNELIQERYNQTIDNGYIVFSQNNKGQLFDSDNILVEIYSLNNNNYPIKVEEDFSDLFDINNIDTDSIILSKKLSILKNLYLQVINDIASDNSDNLEENNDSKYMNAKLWIPFEYVFEYVSDGINKTIIYGGHKNIYVYIEPNLKDNNQYYPTRDGKNGLIFIQQPQSYEKSSIYSFMFSHETEEPGIIRNLVLPYINENHEWVINNHNTGVSAKAENATNLNIILAYLYKSGNNIQFKILSGLNNYVVTNDKLSSEQVYIKRRNGKTFNIECYIPEISKIQDQDITTSNEVKAEIVDILKNSTIILMTKLTKLIDDDDVKKEYKDGLITTIWTYNTLSTKYEYISLEKDDEGNNLALDFADITNFNNLINYTVANIEQVEPDNYLHTHLIFDQILKQNKQEVSNNAVYAVLQNIKAAGYNKDNYNNNFNFSLRYLNNIVGTPGDVIEKVRHTTENRYLIVSNDDKSDSVTNSLYTEIKNGEYQATNEYLPNYNIPLFDMSEFLIKDSNVINRQNILSFSSTGQIYYSYIGTLYSDADKTYLHIGTSKTNINLGEESLIKESDKSKFLQHTGISLDFDNIKLNGNTTIKDDLKVQGNSYFSKINWDISNIKDNSGNNITIYTTTLVPKFNFIQDSVGKYYHEIGIDSMETQLNQLYRYISSTAKYNTSQYLYCNIILKHNISGINYYYKYGDLLYIDNLLKYLGLDNINFNEIKSNTNQIIYNSNGKAIFMISSNNQLSNSIVINASSDTEISIETTGIDDFYCANMLNIIHSIDNGNHILIINEHQSNKIKSIWKLPYQI